MHQGAWKTGEHVNSMSQGAPADVNHTPGISGDNNSTKEDERKYLKSTKGEIWKKGACVY